MPKVHATNLIEPHCHGRRFTVTLQQTYKPPYEIYFETLQINIQSKWSPANHRVYFLLNNTMLDWTKCWFLWRCVWRVFRRNYEQTGWIVIVCFQDSIHAYDSNVVYSEQWLRAPECMIVTPVCNFSQAAKLALKPHIILIPAAFSSFRNRLHLFQMAICCVRSTWL